jgi:hypothetical protein
MQVRKWDGKPISEPGWYSGVPIERYHSAGLCNAPAVSSSDLRTCWRLSPAHAHLYWAENPKREPKPPSRAMLLGAAAHWLLLGEDDFKRRYVAQPETYRDTVTAKEKPWHNGAAICKAWNAAQAKSKRLVITVAELKTIVEMAKSLALEPLVDAGLLRGHIECSGFIKDRETGLWLKIRPDVVPPTGADFVDVKTTSEVTTPALQSTIRSYGYHQQGALIWEVCEQLELPFTMFILMFIETAAPFCARAVPLTEDDLSRGRLMNRAMMRKFASCIINDHWPGPGEGELRALPLGHDERSRIDQRLQFEGVLSGG